MDGYRARLAAAAVADACAQVEASDSDVGPDLSGLTYRQRLAYALGDRSKYAGGKYPNELEDSPRAGLRPATADDAARLKALRVPPKWTGVHVSEDPEAALQAIGTDQKGRTQYLYSAAHSEAAAAEKFARVAEFHAKLPALRRSIVSDLDSPIDNDREAAAVLYLIDKTGFRVGSNAETKGDVKAYGASTLLSKHAEVDGKEVTFRFTAKKGVPIVKTVKDERLAGLIANRQEGRQPDDPLFETTDAGVRTYMTDVVPGHSPKDFRTYRATAVALKAVKSLPAPKTEKELKRAQLEVSKLVAAELGNTPTVAKQSYIDPSVWARLGQR